MAAENNSPSPKRSSGLMYNINDNPPWHISIFVAFQHCLTLFGPTLITPILLAQVLCIQAGSYVKASLFCSTVFCLGISTILQVTFGSRLPMVQGAAVEYLVAILSLVDDNCNNEAMHSINKTHQEMTNNTISSENWNIKLRKIHGAIMVAGIMEFIIGMIGLIGMIRRFITPLVIVPSLTMMGIMIVPLATNLSSKHWGIAILTLVLAIFFSQHLYRFDIPCYKYSRSKGCRNTSRFPLFKVFSIILAVVISWILCSILTVAGVFPDSPDFDESNGYFARTDIRKSIYQDASWFIVPYPGQWGMPIFTATASAAMIPPLLASIIDSLSEYYGCARMCSLPPPPNHSLNRGIASEGLGTIISGAIGFGSGITTVGGNVGLIGLTKIASRRVIQVMSVILILMGMLGKFGAFFATIPDPVVGGILCIGVSMMMGVAFSNLQDIDVTSRRNIFILGFSIFAGAMFPSWIKEHPEKLATGVSVIDDIFNGLLKSQMFVAGLIGLILDNTIPGTPEERGIIKKKNLDDVLPEIDELDNYNPPFYSYYNSLKWLRFLPIFPTFKLHRKICRRNQQKTETLSKDVSKSEVLDSVSVGINLEAVNQLENDRSI